MTISAELINDNEIQVVMTLETAMWLCSVISYSIVPDAYFDKQTAWHDTYRAINRAIPNGIPIYNIFGSGKNCRLSAEAIEYYSNHIAEKVL